MNKHVATRIRRMMSARNIRQVDLVNEIGCTAGAMSSWLSSRVMPSPKNLEKIAKCLKVTSTYLMTGYDESYDPERDDMVALYKSLSTSDRVAAMKMMEGLKGHK